MTLSRHNDLDKKEEQRQAIGHKNWNEENMGSVTITAENKERIANLMLRTMKVMR